MPKQMSKAEYADFLKKKLQAEKAKGTPPDKCLEILSEKQYDFLADYDDFLDVFMEAKPLNASNIGGEKRQRRLSPDGYNKIYPQDKIDLFNAISSFLNEQGATIMPKPKENYRDLDFTLNGKHYKIVLSNPRK